MSDVRVTSCFADFDQQNGFTGIAAVVTVQSLSVCWALYPRRLSGGSPPQAVLGRPGLAGRARGSAVRTVAGKYSSGHEALNVIWSGGPRNTTLATRMKPSTVQVV